MYATRSRDDGLTWLMFLMMKGLFQGHIPRQGGGMIQAARGLADMMKNE